MTATYVDGGVLIAGTRFDIAQTFLCGQCFRFDRTDDGFGGIAQNRYVSLVQTDEGVLIKTTEHDFESIWRRYFDLDTDYDAMIDTFPADDVHLCDAVSHCGGIRILRQDAFEALISFVISQNNNIPRIKKLINALSERYGARIDGGYAFPTPESLIDANIDDMHFGYRAPYIISAARDYYDGRLSFERISAMSYSEAKKELLLTHGIGPKVADCALLFGYGFMQAFPVDTWIKKVMAERYGKGFDPSYFGRYAGLAQQYLFYYERGTRE